VTVAAIVNLSRCPAFKAPHITAVKMAKS